MRLSRNDKNLASNVMLAVFSVVNTGCSSLDLDSNTILKVTVQKVVKRLLLKSHSWVSKDLLTYTVPTSASHRF